MKIARKIIKDNILQNDIAMMAESDDDVKNVKTPTNIKTNGEQLENVNG